MDAYESQEIQRSYLILVETLMKNYFAFAKFLNLLDSSKAFYYFVYVCFADSGYSITPWYLQDEIAELNFLRRHKSFILEIESSSAEKWIQSGTFKGFESERDAYLCLSRCSSNFVSSRKCNGCDQNSSKYRCLQCRDMELCSKCYDEEEESSGHLTSHRMVRLR